MERNRGGNKEAAPFPFPYQSQKCVRPNVCLFYFAAQFCPFFFFSAPAPALPSSGPFTAFSSFFGFVFCQLFLKQQQQQWAQ